MEQYPQAKQQSPAPNGAGKNKIHALALLEVGLFELGFVTAILFFLFGTLNYFNILSVSSAFPQYLSWLPRQKIPASTQSKKVVFPKIVPTLSPSFTYDVKKQKNFLAQYIKNNIQSAYHPVNVETTSLYPTSAATPGEGTVLSSWKTNDNIVISIFIPYKNNSINSSTDKIFIGLPRNSIDYLDASTATSLIKKYLLITNTEKLICSNYSSGITICATKKVQDTDTTLVELQYPFSDIKN